MGCVRCGQKRLPGASRNRPIVVGTANNTVDYVTILAESYAGFNQGQRVFVTGDGVQALIDDGVLVKVGA